MQTLLYFVQVLTQLVLCWESLLGPEKSIWLFLLYSVIGSEDISWFNDYLVKGFAWLSSFRIQLALVNESLGFALLISNPLEKQGR